MCASYNPSIEHDFYSLKFEKPGHVYIFNNRKFNTGLNIREGSEKDVQRLFEIFDELNFDVECYIDKTAKQIRTYIRKMSKEIDYSDSGCILIFIMSHGNEDKIFGTDGEEVYLSSFIDPFTTVKSLKDKPKLFFFNACRGDEMTPTHDHDGDDDDEYKASIHLNELSKTPIVADIAFFFSTTANYYSIRECENGSWYIQILCDVIDKYKTKKDLLQIMTKVNDLVKKKEGKDKKGRLVKMHPTFTSQLGKEFYFTLPKNVNFYKSIILIQNVSC